VLPAVPVSSALAAAATAATPALSVPQNQAPKAGITGTITDPTGSGVAGATVQVAGSSSKSVTTDAQGQYAVTDLAEGAYLFSVTAHGTKGFEANVVLSPAQMLTLGVGINTSADGSNP